MPQPLISQFDRKFALPIETYRQVLNPTLRDSIPIGIRWEGMLVYVVSEGKSYQLSSGTNNTFWQDLGSLVNVTVVDNLLSSSTTDALSANQGRILNDNFSDYQLLSEKGAALGYVPLNGSGLIDSSYLPSYVDDILEFANLASFPDPGEIGKVYIALDTNLMYRWSGTVYVGVSGSVSITWGAITGTLSAQTDLQTALNTKENAFSKNTGFNKNFGTTAGTVSEGNHTHTFASLTSKPTTIGGYGITDFNSLGDARWLGISATAANSSLLDSIDSSQFLRSDVVDRKTAGNLILNDNVAIDLGTGSDSQLYDDGSTLFLNLYGHDLQIRQTTTTRFTFGRTTGNLTATGIVTANSFKTPAWEIVQNGNNLEFKYSGVVKARMNTTGIFEATDHKMGL